MDEACKRIVYEAPPPLSQHTHLEEQAQGEADATSCHFCINTVACLSVEQKALAIEGPQRYEPSQSSERPRHGGEEHHQQPRRNRCPEERCHVTAYTTAYDRAHVSIRQHPSAYRAYGAAPDATNKAART